jgi:Na+/citrate or Na+/malate symporter
MLPVFSRPERAMYVGKTLFAQVMDVLPWKTFHRIVARYGGDYRTRMLSCAEQFRIMAFAQMTYRESLRDIRSVRLNEWLKC